MLSVRHLLINDWDKTDHLLLHRKFHPLYSRWLSECWRRAEVSIPIPFTVPTVFKTVFRAVWINPAYYWQFCAHRIAISRRPSLSIRLLGLVYGGLIILNLYLSRMRECDTLTWINCGYDLFALTRGSFTYSASDWHRREDSNLYLAVLETAMLLVTPHLYNCCF